MIEVKNLTKVFKGDFWKKPFTAVDNISFSVQRGEIFGFLGLNGAGKTTTIKILMSLIYPTSGNATIMGKSVTDVKIKNKIGFLPENPYFYDYLKTEEFLDFYMQLFNMGKDERERNVKELISLVRLDGAYGRYLRKFSKGMLQRIGIAQALVNDPDLLIFDEPMSGLDPIGRREIRDLIIRLKERGKTIFFSSHILSDVEMICERVAIIHRGKIVSTGCLDDLLKPELENIEIVTEGFRDEFIPLISPLCNVDAKRRDKLYLKVDSEEGVDRIYRIVKDNGGRIISINYQRESLEDLFLRKVDQ